MNDAQENRLSILEAKKTDGSITGPEEAVRIALLELDERGEDVDAANKALADAIAAQPAPPVNDPVAIAQQKVVEAQAAKDEAQKAVDVAEAAIPTPAAL